MRRLLSTLALALLAAACGSESAVVDRLASASAAPPVATPAPAPTPTPAPPPSTSTLVLAGDVQVEDDQADVATEPLPAVDGRTPRLRLEVRHRVGGSSTPDAIVVFLNVPAKAGTYALHSPETTLVPGRVYAFVTTRGEALGSMKDFNSNVAGTLTLRREAGALAGTFRVSAHEPPPPPPPKLKPGEVPPRPIVGTIPAAPPTHVQASGTLLATVPTSIEETTTEAAAVKTAPRSARRGNRTQPRDLTGG